MEVSLISNDRWLKVDQCVKYLNMIQQAKPPILRGIMTVVKGPNQDVEVKLGVFLCLWNDEKEKEKSDVRISLLWHSKTCNREEASKAFGRLLQGVCDSSTWIRRVDTEPSDSQYEYFGSNCCKVGDMVCSYYWLHVCIDWFFLWFWCSLARIAFCSKFDLTRSFEATTIVFVKPTDRPRFIWTKIARTLSVKGWNVEESRQ